MSVTGDYVFAQQALEWGLVNEVVAPEELMPRALELANTSSTIDAVPQLLATCESSLLWPLFFRSSRPKQFL